MANIKQKVAMVHDGLYASHSHFIPHYILHALTIVSVLVMACFLQILWQRNQAESLQPVANLAIAAVDDLYIPAIIAPLEKKQYVYSANVRFSANNPYDNIHYAYDPGSQNTPTSSTIVVTTHGTLQALEAPMKADVERALKLIPDLQQCSRLYVIRFLPGLTTYGGFAPYKEIQLKDGRTAYIHKNIQCVNKPAMTSEAFEKIESVVASIESY